MFFSSRKSSSFTRRTLRLESLETRTLLSGNPPEANPDSDSTDEATFRDINVLSNDTDDENDVLTVSAFDATSVSGATITLNQDGTLRYDPSASSVLNALAVGEMIDDTFTYTVSDGTSPATATVTITVSGLNDDPTATPDTPTISEDGPAQSFDLTGNDTDPDTSDDLEIQSIDTTGTLGTVTIDPDNDAVTYNPNGQFEQLKAGESATDTFTYTITDGQGGTSTATVTVSITGQNDAPVITSADTASVPENTTAVLTVTATDVDVQTPTFSIASGQDGALFDINTTTGVLTFRNAPNFESPTDADTNNEYLVTVQASDGVATTTQVITITVTNVNEAPVNTVPTAQQQLFRNGTLTFRTANNNALSVADVDADTSDIRVELRVTNGVLKLGTTAGVTVTGDNTAVVTVVGSQAAINTALQNSVFTPPAGFTGNVTLTMTTNDQGNTGPGGALEDIDTVTLRVGNRVPNVLSSQAFHTTFVSRPAQIRRLNVPASLGLLSRVRDLDGDRLTIQLLSGPKTANGQRVGTLAIRANGAFTYTPPDGFVGRVTFRYRVGDGVGFSAPITVTIDVLLPIAASQRRWLPN